MKRYYAEQFFDGENFHSNTVFSVANGKIVSVEHQQTYQQSLIKLTGLVAPGFVDLQVNGGGGVLFNTATSIDDLTTLFLAHARFGTVAMLPTIITDTNQVMQQAADIIITARQQHLTGILGIHYEGPHLASAKKGAHSEQFIRQLTDAELAIYQNDDLGKILITLAPENVSTSKISQLCQLGIKVSLGHSNATFQQAQQALAAGASSFTHLYNAMSPLQGREPGMVGAALLADDAYCGLILDGHHVDYSSCLLAMKSKAKDKIYLVTDAMPPVATEQTEFDFFDRKVTLTDGKLISTTKELAGSVLDMATAVRNCVQHLSVPLAQALNMASLYPAQYIEVDDVLGRLLPDYQASFVVLNDDLVVQSTWVAGEQVY